MQSDFCVSQKERVISQLCYLSTYCYVFYFWSPWVPVACPKFACRRTQIYAHAGVHMCRNNTVDNISANRNVWYTSAHWVTGENTHTHIHACTHTHTHRHNAVGIPAASYSGRKYIPPLQRWLERLKIREMKSEEPMTRRCSKWKARLVWRKWYWTDKSNCRQGNRQYWAFTHVLPL